MSPLTRNSMPPPDKSASVLLVSADREDRSSLTAIFEPLQWQMHTAESFRGAVTLLKEHPVAVVVCEHRLPDGSWGDVLKTCTGLHAPPALIVCSRLADEYLWTEVLNLGGYDVLVKPFD